MKVHVRWKAKYTSEETCQLKQLVDDASRNNLQFVYCLRLPNNVDSLDEKVQLQVKNKLQQVQELQVKHFALLFDALDPDIFEDEDEDMFEEGDLSLGNLQARLANHLFHELKYY